MTLLLWLRYAYRQQWTTILLIMAWPFGGFNTEACGRGCVGRVNCEVINIMEEIWLGQMPGFGTFYDKRISLRTEDRFCHRRIPSSLRPWVAGDERPLIIEHQAGISRRADGLIRCIRVESLSDATGIMRENGKSCQQSADRFVVIYLVTTLVTG